MVETRVAPRHRVIKPAEIEFGGYKRVCIIRDLSITGAALEVMDQASIPKHFNLVVPEDNLKLPCAIVWRRGFRIPELLGFNATPDRGAEARRTGRDR